MRCQIFAELSHEIVQEAQAIAQLPILEAEISSELGFAPQPAPQNTRYSLTDLVASESSGSLLASPPALPPNLQANFQS